MKNHYKRARFSCETKSEHFDQRTLIEQAFRAVNTTAVRNSINYCMKVLGLPEVDSVFPKVAKRRASV